MKNNREFLNSLYSNKSRFYLFDFHVHSPASFDVRIGERFDKLSNDEKAMLCNISESLSKSPINYERKVLEYFPVDKYYELLVNHKNKITNNESISEGEDWAFIAITDHNVCKYASELSKYAWNSELLKKIDL